MINEQEKKYLQDLKQDMRYHLPDSVPLTIHECPEFGTFYINPELDETRISQELIDLLIYWEDKIAGEDCLMYHSLKDAVKAFGIMASKMEPLGIL